MKKYYIFIIIFSVLLIGISVYSLSIFQFNKKNNTNNLIDDFNITNKEFNFISLGDFLEMIILNSIDDVDYKLIKTDSNHYASPYLAIAENFDVVEKGTITEEMLDEHITKIYALKLCALCDINIRHNERQEYKGLEIYKQNNLTDVEKSLLGHSLAKGFVNELSSEDFVNNDFLTSKEASKILSAYVNAK